jgi:hypothetical protein
MDTPKECRDHTTQCIQMANEASDAKARSVLFGMAKAWIELAERGERGQAIRAQLQGGGVENHR